MNSTILKCLTVLFRISPSNAAASVNFKKLTEAEDNFVNLLSKFSSRGKNNGLALRILAVNALKQAN
jgi:hypothetical protein